MIGCAAIISVGNELLLGKTVDTNAAFLARWCAQQGLPVHTCRTVADNEEVIAITMRELARSNDLVVVTGGLGPTLDDRTRHALAMAAGRSLQESASAWRAIQRYYNRRRPGEPVPESNRRQALVPQGAQTLRNDRGTAPGLLTQVDGTWVVCLPGVPVEMTAMVERLQSRLPRLISGLEAPTVSELHCAGVGESLLQDHLGALLADEDAVQVGITVHERGFITLRVLGVPQAVEQRIRALRRAVQVWLLPEPGLAESVVAALRQRQWTVSTVESCTGGRVAAALTAVAGASEVFAQGAIAYANAVKSREFAVPETVLSGPGAVSEECVRILAENGRLRTGSDICCAVSGVAGPGGGTRRTPVGTVWVAAASAQACVTRLLHLTGEREQIQQRAAQQALLLTWELIKEHSSTSRRGSKKTRH